MLDYLTVSTSRIEDRPRASLGLRVSKDSTVELVDPVWLVAVGRQINQFFLLKPNWDSNGALPIDFESAMGALAFLVQNALHDMPAPHIVPMSNGGIQIEWHRVGIEIEISFEPSEAPKFWCLDANGAEYQGELEQQMLLVASFLRRLPPEDECYGYYR